MARGLMGLVAHDGRWLRPEAVADKAKADPALAEYQDRRLKAPYTADAQFALGIWAEEHGLQEQAKAHLTAVIRLDPKRDAAWKKLGYRKHDGRWTTDAQLAAEKTEAEAQRAADRKWKPLLERYKSMLERPSVREEAESALLEVTDPRAVPMIGVVFAKTESSQVRAVQLLGQIDSAAASRSLTFLAVFAGSAEARRLATETLRGRDPREYANLLISMIRDPIKYEVRPVAGPGSQGILYVEGPDKNVKRLYSPPSAPTMVPMQGDIVGTDESGLPVINRSGMSTTLETGRVTADVILSMYQIDRLTNSEYLQEMRRPLSGRAASAFENIENAYVSANLHNSFVDVIKQTAKFEHRPFSGFGYDLEFSNNHVYSIPIGQIWLEAQKAANSAQRQLSFDVSMLEACNKAILAKNEKVRRILADAVGKDLGDDTMAWKAWWVDQLGYVLKITADPPKTTVVEEVPLAYQPQPVPIQDDVTSTTVRYRRNSCFGAGTPIRTVEGPRPIESLKVGDLVLSQNIGTGSLGYKPIVVVHHNPPSATYRIKLGGDSIISSHFHRFWVAGRGWVMARELKSGDPIRTLGGVIPVESVESDKVQPVYNLDIADDADFFAGNAAALVHDNSLPDPRLVPFDAAPKPTGKNRGE